MTNVVEELEDTTISAEPETQQVLAQEAVFFENCVLVKLSGGVEKYISYRDFIGVIRNISNDLDNAKIEGFCLPSNTFYFAHSGEFVNLSCYYASKVCPLKYYDKKFDVLMPNVIISHQLRREPGKEDWVVQGTRYFSTDVNVGRLPKTFIFTNKPSERVFGFPMTNTYREGNMCYGGNTMPTKFTENNLRGLDWYYQYLWESPFNDDLGVHAVRDVSPLDWYNTLRKAAEKNEPFPYNLLRNWTAQT